MVSYLLKEGSFPTNITSLEIGNTIVDVGQLLPPPSLLERGSHKLSSLTTLTLEGPTWPWGEEGMFLPTSLIKLIIFNFPNLERLSYEEFQNLTSLQTLDIWGCNPILKQKGLVVVETNFRMYSYSLSKLHCEIFCLFSSKSLHENMAICSGKPQKRSQRVNQQRMLLGMSLITYNTAQDHYSCSAPVASWRALMEGNNYAIASAWDSLACGLGCFEKVAGCG
ncbi:unnamed protein product [Camellia sinensis]